MIKSPFASYAFYIVAMFAIGFTAAFLFPVGEWHANLVKPPFNPPNWVFGPVWTILYVLIGSAGSKAARGYLPGGVMGLWWAQWALNGLWTALFFGAQLMGVALIEIVILLGVIVAFMVSAWSVSKTASLLFVPYALWVGFAAVLNASFWWLN